MASLASLVLACPAFALQTAPVFVVDSNGGPGFDYLDLQSAISASPAGSILILRGGSYQGAVVDRALTIVSDIGFTGRPVIEGLLDIRDLPEFEVVDVNGVDMIGGYGGVRVEDSAGIVRLTDLNLGVAGYAEDGTSVGPRIVTIDSSLRLDRVTIGAAMDGTAPPLAEVPTSNAAPLARLEIESSRVHIYDSEILGLPGRDASPNPFAGLPIEATRGGSGIEVNSASLVRIASSTIAGGPGGAGVLTNAVGCVAPRDGGDGLLVTAGYTTSLALLDSLLTGGPGGLPAMASPFVECPSTAGAGQPIQQLAGAAIGATTSPAVQPSLEVPALIREDNLAVIALQFEAGEIGFWAYSIDPPVETQVPLSVGFVTELGTNYALQPLGPSGGMAGTLVLGTFEGLVPPGTGIEVYSQVISVSVTGEIRTGEFGTTVIVDEQF
jgi:hypothetical protein